MGGSHSQQGKGIRNGNSYPPEKNHGQNPSCIGRMIQGAGQYYTPRLDMTIGKHEKVLSWEINHLREDILRYLPIPRLRCHNSEINWEFETLRWRSPYCQKQCLPAAVVVKVIFMEELLQKDPENVYQVGTMVYHDEEEKDMALRLPGPDREWSIVFIR